MEQIINQSCYSIQKTSKGFWVASNRSVSQLDTLGKTVHRYPIRNPSGFCLYAPSDEVGVLDTSGRFFLIHAKKHTVTKIDNKAQFESCRPMLIGNRMLWVQWNGVVRMYDFAKQKLKCVAVLDNGVHTRGYTFDPLKNKIYVLFSYPPKLQTSFASIDLVSGNVLIQKFPFRYPKDIDKICIYNGNYLCLRTRHPALFLISSEDFSVLKKINLRTKLWTIYGFYWDEPRNVVYIWHDTAVVKVDIRTFDLQTVWEDEYISDVTVAENGDVCIGTWEKGIVITQKIM